MDDKLALMHKLGKRQMTVELELPVDAIPSALSPWELELSDSGDLLTYTYNPDEPHKGIAKLLNAISETGMLLKDVNTSQSSLEDIFVNLVKAKS